MNRPFCPTCNKASRISHIEDHRRTFESEWSCSRCGKLFRVKENCRECIDCSTRSIEKHCINDHRFTIYHKCVLKQEKVK